jgi:prepilin-type N-terminal cleavage/methylation domain-containing protein
MQAVEGWGFTLIELINAVAIINILLAAAVS